MSDLVIYPLKKMIVGHGSIPFWTTADRKLYFRRDDNGAWIAYLMDYPMDKVAGWACNASYALQARTLKRLLEEISKEATPMWEKPLEIRPLRKVKDENEMKWVSRDGGIHFSKNGSRWKAHFVLTGPLGHPRFRHTMPPWFEDQTLLSEWTKRHGLESGGKTLRELVERIERAQRIDPLHKIFIPSS